MSKPLTVADVGRELGISRTRVIALDDKLQPRRCECGDRLYDRARVDELIGWRAVTSRKVSR